MHLVSKIPEVFHQRNQIFNGTVVDDVNLVHSKSTKRLMIRTIELSEGTSLVTQGEVPANIKSADL